MNTQSQSSMIDEDKFNATLTNIIDYAGVGKMPYQALNIDEGVMNAWYNQAITFYNSNQYDRAIEYFSILISLDGSSYDYVYGVASCLMMQKKYDKAIEMFSLAFVNDATRADPLYQAALCYFKKGDMDECESSILDTLDFFGKNAIAKDVKEKMDSLLVMVEQVKLINK